MWKDYFYFNRQEKRAILLLSLLLFFILGLNAFIPRLTVSEKKDYSIFIQKINEYYEALKEDSIQNARESLVFAPTQFKIDTVSETWLVQHGLSKLVARSLINYRNKGGDINNDAKFRAIYGMNDSIFNIWNTFVVYAVNEDTTSSKQKYISVNAKQEYRSSAPEFQIDINRADTAEFVLLYGIGPAFAERFVKYRDVLGGYYCVDQIKDVYGMDSVRFAQIKPYLKVEPIELRKMLINRASLKQMKNNPYLNFYQAKAIYEYRKAGNIIDNWNELIQIPSLDTAGINFLKPYLAYTETLP